ncbi:hypothetical protein FOXG_22482 [Fusarium oxysporum f. sp. lycopersici 4287]|uniref:Uncharacterized protein n=1 Tax=Fusarium oxysporum f. sp. lycopersici (strain 4287 / CBS 123668 / FGSC 9935 / NRRL 34936) TaxID=426428 RepID=A0A0J9W994_FUSO4|nr:hypothetical protein FOXG_22482 [Fusarium oxysporum f. sp. lycopersici 4287]KNB19185.1 hypothetical protein FOXG_22482 [Fusarium oxysporum f. sp. lycopersici 4287]
MLFSDENGESACPQPTRALDGEKITLTHPTKTTGRNFDRQEATDSKNTSGTLNNVIDEAVCPVVPENPPQPREFDITVREEKTDRRFEFDFSDLVDPNAKVIKPASSLRDSFTNLPCILTE